MSSTRSRLPLIDALKAVASQMIVLHHLAFYGPMSDYTHQVLPGLVSWFSQYGRLAVQVFLVVSGFLAVRTLAPDGVLKPRHPLGVLRRRYVNIVLPYVVALLLAVLATDVATLWMNHHSLPEEPEVMQFLAHAALLNGVLDFDSLSAGVWYVAIDFQLFALLLGVLWVARKFSGVESVDGAVNHARIWPAVAMVSGVGAASLLYFNLDATWDNWALYFFGAYAMGAVAYWANHLHHGRWQGLFLAFGLGLAVLALTLDFRSRIALALGVALLLGVAQAQGWLTRWPRSNVLGYLGKISYGVFLMNFPVGLVVNAWFSRFALPDPWVQTAGVALAWMATVVAGALFYHLVEVPLRQWGQPGAVGSLWLRLATLLTRKV